MLPHMQMARDMQARSLSNTQTMAFSTLGTCVLIAWNWDYAVLYSAVLMLSSS